MCVKWVSVKQKASMAVEPCQSGQSQEWVFANERRVAMTSIRAREGGRRLQPRSSALRRGPLLAVVVALTIGGGVNVLWSATILADRSPIQFHATPRLQEIVTTDGVSWAGPNMPVRFNMYLDLRDHAEGLLLQSPDGLLSEQLLGGLSGMRREAAPRATVSSAQAAILRERAATTGLWRSSRTGADQKYAIVPPTGSDTVMVAAFHGDDLYFVGDSALEDVMGRV